MNRIWSYCLKSAILALLFSAELGHSMLFDCKALLTNGSNENRIFHILVLGALVELEEVENQVQMKALTVQEVRERVNSRHSVRRNEEMIREDLNKLVDERQVIRNGQEYQLTLIGFIRFIRCLQLQRQLTKRYSSTLRTMGNVHILDDLTGLSDRSLPVYPDSLFSYALMLALAHRGWANYTLPRELIEELGAAGYSSYTSEMEVASMLENYAYYKLLNSRTTSNDRVRNMDARTHTFSITSNGIKALLRFPPTFADLEIQTLGAPGFQKYVKGYIAQETQALRPFAEFLQGIAFGEG